MGTGLIAVIVVLVVIAAFVIGVFNRLITLKVRANEAWAQIDVQLKRRADLIPNLVETVKGYAKHEKEVFENVTKARSMIQDAGGNVEKSAEANNMLTGALKSLFAVVENYPELKANQNFIMMQQELTATEDKISYARQFYNQATMVYNEYQQAFPGVIFAGMFGHSRRAYFEAAEADRRTPEVKF
ncbi:MAG TPA: LemA family protein [Firmicutes bacterium]|nr:LemA family protein [Bacillota bacterium]